MRGCRRLVAMVDAWRSVGRDETGRQLHPMLMTPYFAGRLAEVRLAGGDADEGGRASSTSCSAETARSGERFWDVELLRLRAAAARERGSPAGDASEPTSTRLARSPPSRAPVPWRRGLEGGAEGAGPGHEERAMIPENLPDYVDRGGRQVWRPPYTASGAKLFGFVLEADSAAIDSLLHRDLNEPAGGAVDYRCAHPSVIVVFAAIEQLASGDPLDKQRGYMSELEVSVWCLAADVTAGSRLVWYLPYVFVDSGQAVASGREVYGYPKQIGLFEDDYPDKLENGGTTTVRRRRSSPTGRTRRRAPRRCSPPTISRPVGRRRARRVRRPGRAVRGPARHPRQTCRSGPRPDPRQRSRRSALRRPPRAAASVPAWAGRRVLDTLLGRGRIEGADDLIGRDGREPDARLPQAVPGCLLPHQGVLPGNRGGAAGCPRVDGKLQATRSAGVQDHDPGLGQPSDRQRAWRACRGRHWCPSSLPARGSTSTSSSASRSGGRPREPARSLMAKPRIAILGGGAGAVTAALELSKPGWGDHYESITVYQQGWRLGGKGACGRGPDLRIEEHGLHLWFGFYENAFRLLDRCHEELDQRAKNGQPRWDLAFKNVEDSFSPLEQLAVPDYDGCGWRLWVADFFDDDDDRPWLEPDPRPPGERPDEWTVAFYAVRCLRLAADFAWSLVESDPGLARIRPAAAERPRGRRSRRRRGRPRASSLRGDVQAALDAAANVLDALAEEAFDQPVVLGALGIVVRALDVAGDYLRRRFDEVARASDSVRRAYYVVDLMVAIVRGVIEDGVIAGGQLRCRRRRRLSRLAAGPRRASRVGRLRVGPRRRLRPRLCVRGRRPAAPLLRGRNRAARAVARVLHLPRLVDVEDELGYGRRGLPALLRAAHKARGRGQVLPPRRGAAGRRTA